MRRSGSYLNSKGLGPRRRSSQHLQLAPHVFSCTRALCVLGLLTVLLLFWRAAARGRARDVNVGEGSFLQSGADLSRNDQRSLQDSADKAIFAVGEGARTAMAEAAAAPAKERSLGFYWGIQGHDASNGAAALAPGLSLEHLQKVAGESAKQSLRGKLTSGFYFTHDIPAKLKAGSMRSQPAHRKELQRSQETAHPLGYYFQEEAHRGGLTGNAATGAQSASPAADKPLKYYFTQDIPDDAKRQLAFQGVMRARMEAQEHTTHHGKPRRSLLALLHNHVLPLPVQ